MGEHALFQTIEKVGGGFCFEGIGIPEHRLTRLWEFDPLQPPSSEVLSQVIDTAVATAIDQLGEEAWPAKVAKIRQPSKSNCNFGGRCSGSAIVNAMYIGLAMILEGPNRPW